MRLSLSKKIYVIVVLLLVMAIAIAGIAFYSLFGLSQSLDDLSRFARRAFAVNAMNQLVLEREVMVDNIIAITDEPIMRKMIDTDLRELDKRMDDAIQEVVLVHGATGGVGTLAVQLARRTGATVFGTAGDAAGAALVRDLGAHRVFSHKEEGYIQKIAAAADGGVDVVIEMLADVNLTRDLSLLAKRGRVVIVGRRGSLEFAPRDAMATDAAILGMMVGNMRPEEYKANMSALSAALSAALEGGMRVVVGEEMPLAEAARAHKLVMEGGNPGKVILTT